MPDQSLLFFFISLKSLVRNFCDLAECTAKSEAAAVTQYCDTVQPSLTIS